MLDCFCFSNLHVQCIEVTISYYFYTYIFVYVLYSSCLNGCVGWWPCCGPGTDYPKYIYFNVCWNKQTLWQTRF